MLKTRIITAVLLLSVFLIILFFMPVWVWVVFATLVASLGAWEWGGLMALDPVPRVSLGIVFASICVVIAFLYPAALGLFPVGFAEAAWPLGRWFYIPAVFFWLVITPLWMRFRWHLPKTLPGAIIGLLLLLPPWLALIQLRQRGEFFLMAIMAIVWLADIGAYFFGRRFGRHKLAPTISPGKTWEGALGGGIVVIAYGFLIAPKLPGLLSDHPVILLVFLMILTTISITGDLFESLLKRQTGLKDSSNILPGHGGVLDRIDSLISTLPLVTLAWLMYLN